jgi:hypothetical protein
MARKQRTIAHELRDDKNWPFLGADAVQLDKIGVVEISVGGGRIKISGLKLGKEPPSFTRFSLKKHTANLLHDLRFRDEIVLRHGPRFHHLDRNLNKQTKKEGKKKRGKGGRERNYTGREP